MHGESRTRIGTEARPGESPAVTGRAGASKLATVAPEASGETPCPAGSLGVVFASVSPWMLGLRAVICGQAPPQGGLGRGHATPVKWTLG